MLLLPPGARHPLCGPHGNDFAFTGHSADLDWVLKHMGSRFLCKISGRLGGDADDVKELRLLTRVIRWTQAGISTKPMPAMMTS